MLITFTKMHGAGNDYIYVDATDFCPENLSELAQQMSDRHKGVGADGLVAILKSECADFRMRMFNADGSEGEMCGNASRCIAKFVYDKQLTSKRNITLETLAGIKILHITQLDNNGRVKEVTVDMGEPNFRPELIPVAASEPVVEKPIETSIGTLNITALSTGNPHCVIFLNEINSLQIDNIGKEIQNNQLFPNKANVEFVKVHSKDRLQMRVYERGSGETMACGTGACATLVAAAVTGRSNRKALVNLLGGDLYIEWREDNHLLMTGGATTVFEGTYEWK